MTKILDSKIPEGPIAERILLLMNRILLLL